MKGGNGAPISSCASRTAVAMRSASSGSALPPGRPRVLALPEVLLLRSSKTSPWHLQRQARHDESMHADYANIINVLQPCRLLT